MTGIAVCVGAAMMSGTVRAGTVEPSAERDSVQQWRAARVAELKGPDGWLNLVGLFWFGNGENTFGRAPANRIVLDHPALPQRAGSFFLESDHVRFTAAPEAGVTQDGAPVSSIEMVSDAHEKPTTLATGSLRFYVVERSGKLGLRVRDLNSPRIRQLTPIPYYPIQTEWVFDARFEPYEPVRKIRIVNILGLEEDKDSPGALVFNKDGREWRLDAILETRDDPTLFVMFADGTSGKETYGGGRYLHVPRPPAGATGVQTLHVDFNEAYNPPCAFNDFATCPLPPWQNRLALRITAGEKTYGHPGSPGK